MKMLYKFKLLFTLLFLVQSICSFSQTTLSAGDIAFVGLNETASTENGTESNRDFCFILLKNITLGTVINFTDFGWRSDSPAFQTANPCPGSMPGGSGALADGVVQWTATSAMSYGTQILIRCQYSPTTNLGTVTGEQATYNSSSQYVTMTTAGESIFAYQGTLNSPTFIAGLNASPSGWATSLSDCEFNANASTLPSALSTSNYAFTLTPASGQNNMRLKTSISIPNDPAQARTVIANKDNWEISDTSPFELPGANPLPIRLVSATTRIAEKNVIIDWKTADARNFSHFEIEKSLDAKSFQTIGSVDYVSGTATYSFVDTTCYTGQKTIYFRIKMNDLDGSFALSRILDEKVDGNQPNDPKAFPNPFKDYIEVETDGMQKETYVTLTNISGVNLFSKNVYPENNKIILKVGEQIPEGIYILSIPTALGTRKIKVYKK